jgi:hypothetical protein
VSARDVALALTPAPRPVSERAPVVTTGREQSAVRAGTLVTLGIGVALMGSAIAAQAASKDPGMSSPAAFFAGSGLGVASVGGVMLYFDLSPRGAASSRKDSVQLRP